MMRGNLHHHLEILAGRLLMIMVAVLVSMVLVGEPLTVQGDIVIFHPKIMILKQMGSLVVFQRTEVGHRLGAFEDVVEISRVLENLMGQMDTIEVQVEGSMTMEAEIEVKMLEGVVETEAEAESTLMVAVVAEANLMVGAEVEVRGVEVSLML